MKNLNLYIYLDLECVEFTLNNIDYRVDFQYQNFCCIYNSMKFSYVNENYDTVEIPSTALESHGFDLDFIEWVHEEINDRLKDHFEEYYGEEDDDSWKDKYYSLKYGF